MHLSISHNRNVNISVTKWCIVEYGIEAWNNFHWWSLTVLTAVAFIRPVSTIVHAIAECINKDTKACELTLGLIKLETPYRESKEFTDETETKVAAIMQWISSNPWWRHQMETFSVLLDLCAGNSPVAGEFSQRPVTPIFDVFFDLRLIKRLSKQSWGWWFETQSCSLWRHCNAFLEGRIVFLSKFHCNLFQRVNLFNENPALA